LGQVVCFKIEEEKEEEEEEEIGKKWKGFKKRQS